MSQCMSSVKRTSEKILLLLQSPAFRYYPFIACNVKLVKIYENNVNNIDTKKDGRASQATTKNC